jgi:hypothetical protein
LAMKSVRARLRNAGHKTTKSAIYISADIFLPLRSPRKSPRPCGVGLE